MLIRIAVVAFLAVALVFAACDDHEDFVPLPDPTPNEVDTPEPGIPPDAEGWRWETLEPLPEGPRQETAVAALDGSVYLIGGFSAGSVVSTVEAYDTDTDEWRRVADLPVEMHHANVAAVDGRLYVLGFLTGIIGFVEDGRSFVYDPGDDAWEEIAPMPEGTERGASAVTVLDGRIIVAGGLRGRSAVAAASAYDPATGEWEALPDLPEPLDHVVAEAVDGIVYVLGGRAGTITAHSPRVYAWDPGDNEWTAREPMPTSRGGAASATIDGLIVVLGGEGNATDPTGVFPEVEAYDPAADEWLRLPEMPSPRHGTGAATVGDAIYVPGGANIQGAGAVATFDRLILER